MKKTVKKLELSKETLKDLEADTLKAVDGGIVSRTNCTTIANTAC